MLDIILSDPFVVAKHEARSILEDLEPMSFGMLLKLLKETSSRWAYDLGIRVEHILGKESRVIYQYGTTITWLTMSTRIDIDDVVLGVNHGYRARVMGIAAEDPDGHLHNLEVYCMNGEVMHVELGGTHEDDNKKEEIRMEDRLFAPWSLRRCTWVNKPSPVIDVQTFGDPVNTVKCTFANGESTTAVCQEGDEFNLDVGIGICIAKHHFGNAFLRAVRKAKKVYAQGLKSKELQEKNQVEIKALEERKRAKAEKRRDQRREKRIEEQTEAIIRAMIYFDSVGPEDEEVDIPEKPALTDELVQKMREKNND